MPDQTSAASLPGGSVVVDDLKGIAFYAVGDPGEDDRWVETTAERSDLAVDYALRHGGEVVRVGDDTPGAAPVIRNEDLTAPERAALDAWMRGSADTTGLLYAVRAAVAQMERSEDARLAIADKALRDANELLIGAVENGPWVLIEDPQLRQVVGEYVADTCHSIAAAAGLDEAMERAHDAMPQRLARSLPGGAIAFGTESSRG